MALVTPTLSAGIIKAMTAARIPGTTRKHVADSITTSYNVYAKAAQSCGAFPVLKVNQRALRSQLQKTMAANDRPASAARAWGNAFEAYWKGGTFGGGGTVTAIPGKSALVTALRGIWSSKPTATQAAKKMAKALDAFTRTVVVTSPLPGMGCVGPLV